MNDTITITKTRAKSLTMGQKFQLMSAIQQAGQSVPDADLAAQLSDEFERNISAVAVGRYRKELGLQSVPSLTRAQLKARLDEAERLLAIASQGQLHLGSPQ